MAAVALGALAGCGAPQPGADEAEPEATASSEQGLVTCNLRQDTGYVSGSAFTITLVDADGKPAELDTANAYAVMQAAAAQAGVGLTVVSGFRTMAEQQYLYACYVNCNCNSCNLAASPGYSNHQSGHALDLNTSAAGVYNWLAANAASFGFKRTVPSEAWHWEWWGGGPGGGPCGNTPDNCTLQEAQGCGNFGCGCVDHQCNGVFCPGSGCSAQHTADCGNFGCGCADGTCAGVFCPGSGCTAKETLDCSKFGCGCTDHQCNGGACAGGGCTARETLDCGNYGCNCVDQQCNGGFCPGSGCTFKETADCQTKGCGCVDHQCSGGAQCAGTGCTARQTLDCQAADAGCALGQCVTPEGTFTPDSGTPPVISQDAGTLLYPGERGQLEPAPHWSAPRPPPPTDALEGDPLAPVKGGCSASPGLMLAALGLLALPLRRRAKRAQKPTG